MGVSIIKHLKVLITIIVEYLEFEDPIVSNSNIRGEELEAFKSSSQWVLKSN